jgi:hypothetical protein
MSLAQGARRMAQGNLSDILRPYALSLLYTPLPQNLRAPEGGISQNSTCIRGFLLCRPFDDLLRDHQVLEDDMNGNRERIPAGIFNWKLIQSQPFLACF